MGFSVGFVAGFVGVIALSHAAYSTIALSHAAYSTTQYKGLLKNTEDDFSGPPFNVVVELIVGLVLCTWAAITVPGIFLSIHPHSDDNRMVTLPDNLDFIIFNHRGSVFVPEINMKLKR